MSERMRDLRWPVAVAIVVVAAMFAAFSVTRSDAATAGGGTPQDAGQNLPIQSTEGQQQDQARPDHGDCPDKGGHGHGDGDGDGRGFGGPGGGAPSDQGSSQAAPATPSTTSPEL